VSLSVRILLALLAGVLVGTIATATGSAPLRTFILSTEPLGIIFIRLITMVVVPLVIASLFTGIASLGDVGRLGRIGGRTLAWFLSTTIIAAAIGVTVAALLHVGRGLDMSALPAVSARLESSVSAEPARTYPSWAQSIIDMTPQNPIAAAAQGDLLPLILAVCIFGAAATVISADRRRPVVAFFEGVNDLAGVVIGWVMKLAPIAVFVLIAVLITRSGPAVLQNLLWYMAVVVIVLVLHVSLVLLPILRSVGRIGIATFFRTASDALLLAFSTASSTAALPVSMAAAGRLGVPRDVAGFALPTGTTINKNGAAAYKAVTAVFIAQLAGMHLGLVELLTIGALSAAAAFAGAGVPGSSLVTTMIVLNALGLHEGAAAGIALVAGVDRPLDMCRTTVNTIGNLVGATVVGKLESQQYVGRTS
jgi:Na+/H+-dicarboxylate symporter